MVDEVGYEIIVSVIVMVDDLLVEFGVVVDVVGQWQVWVDSLLCLVVCLEILVVQIIDQMIKVQWDVGVVFKKVFSI